MLRRFYMAGTIAGIGILAVFAMVPSALAAANIESVKLTGPNTITIDYSQPVYTSPGDYTNLTGSYNGYSVVSVGGSGTSIITLTLSGSPIGVNNASGYVTIGTNVQDVDDSQYYLGGTWNIIDALAPALTSFSMSSSENDGTFAGTGDTISLTFNTNEQVTISQLTIAGHIVAVSGSGTGPYTTSWTMENGDTQQSVPVTITMTDQNNNSDHVSFSFAGTNTIPVSTNPVVPYTPVQAPILAQITAVPLVVAVENPSYTFSSTQGGTIEYGGGCTSPTTTAFQGVNTVTFTSLQNGTYGACTISVVNSTGEMSNALDVPSFTVDTANSDSSVSSNSSVMSYKFYNFLAVGSTGPDVTALQERLTAEGVYSGPVTGYYGSLTQAAVIAYQAAHGIQQLGYVGPNTRAALNAGE